MANSSISLNSTVNGNNAMIVMDLGEYRVLSLERGAKIEVRGMVPRNLLGLAEISGKTLIALDNIMVTCEGLYPTYRWCKHVRAIRADRGMHNLVEVINSKGWPKLRAALNHAKVEPMHFPGGLYRTVGYRDEILIDNFSMAGSGGWIVNKKDIDKLLADLPPITDSGELGKAWVESFGYANTDSFQSILLYWKPTYEDGYKPNFWDNQVGDYTSRNYHLFELEYDLGSKRLKSIVDEDGKKILSICLSGKPNNRYFKIGDKLPRS